MDANTINEIKESIVKCRNQVHFAKPPYDNVRFCNETKFSCKFSIRQRICPYSKHIPEAIIKELNDEEDNN